MNNREDGTLHFPEDTAQLVYRDIQVSSGAEFVSIMQCKRFADDAFLQFIQILAVLREFKIKNAGIISSQEN